MAVEKKKTERIVSDCQFRCEADWKTERKVNGALSEQRAMWTVRSEQCAQRVVWKRMKYDSFDSKWEEWKTHIWAEDTDMKSECCPSDFVCYCCLPPPQYPCKEKKKKKLYNLKMINTCIVVKTGEKQGVKNECQKKNFVFMLVLQFDWGM